MDDLTAFIGARLDEDEAAARDGQPDPADPRTGEWTAYGHQPGPADRRQDRRVQMVGTETPETGWTVCEVGQFDHAAPIAAHIARHDPARALREVAAKRAILEAHGPDPLGKFGSIEEPRCLVCLAGRDGYEEQWEADPWPCLTLRHLAAVYNDHPDYRQEWAPDRALPAHGRPRAHLRRPPAHRPPLGSRRPLAAHHRQASHVLARRRATVIRAQAQPWQAAPFCTTREHAAHHPA